MAQTVLHKLNFPDPGPAGHLVPGRKTILRVLAYFDIFNYPLTSSEIKEFAGMHAIPFFDDSMTSLVEEKKLFFYHNYYSLQNNPLLIHRRTQGNDCATKMLEKAERIGRFLYHFPYVRGVGISGSLSKNFADEKSDIDFFIITKANRLWIARTLMHLFKKLTFITGRQDDYCMNYYVDEYALTLEDKNIFTAIELRTLIPVSGERSLNAFFTANHWSTEWLPACKRKQQTHKDPLPSWYSNIIEWLFNNNIGNTIDNWLLSITRRRWDRKEQRGKKNERGLPMGLITSKHFARSNPGAFQEKVLQAYEKKLIELNS